MGLKYNLARLVNRRVCMIKNSKIHKKAAVGNGSQIVNSTIARFSYIYESRVICTDIGAFCSIAPNVVIGGAAHPTSWVSSSPVFYKGKNVFHENFSGNVFDEFKRTTIGNDVWIGSNCLIKSGVTIGDGAIIGMGSVVTHDVPPYEIWAGNPAKCIKKRFSDEMIAELLALQWWNWDEAKLQEYGECFCDAEKLLKELKNNEVVKY